MQSAARDFIDGNSVEFHEPDPVCERREGGISYHVLRYKLAWAPLPRSRELLDSSEKKSSRHITTTIVPENRRRIRVLSSQYATMYLIQTTIVHLRDYDRMDVRRNMTS